MKTLSVKQPWAYLLCAGIKDIENRTWKLPEKYKGERVLIHASANYDGKTPTGCFTADQCNHLCNIREIHNVFRQTRSAIIGSVRFVDWTINHESIWAEKSEMFCRAHSAGIISKPPTYNWIVEDPILFDKPILNVKGKLSFWDYPSPQCDEACFYHCTKGGKQEPDCIKEKKI